MPETYLSSLATSLNIFFAGVIDTGEDSELVSKIDVNPTTRDKGETDL